MNRLETKIEIKITRKLCPMIFAAFLGVFFLSAFDARAADGDAGDIFAGVYFGVRFGAIFPHDANEHFASGVDGMGDLVDVVHQPEMAGFGVNTALGARLDLGWPVWLRSELELGLQRYAIRQRGSGNGSSRAISILWQNYFHPFDRHNPHQIWGGLGLGASFAETRLLNGSGTAENGGVNFVATASLGYDYLVLERSRFSSEYLLLGVSHRFLFAEGFRRELGSQVLVNLTYGF